MASEPLAPSPRSTPSQGLDELIRHIALGCSLATTMIGTVVLTGWAFKLSCLKSLHPDWVSMKANTAVGLTCAGLALLLLHLPSATHNTSRLSLRSRLACYLSGCCTILGILTVIQYVSGIRFGIDEILFSEDPAAINTSSPGRMALSTAICFSLVGPSIFLSQTTKPRSSRWFIIPILTILSFALISILGYVCGENHLYKIGQFTAMALHTAIAFVFLCFGTLVLYKTTTLFQLITDKGPGGSYTRSLLPTALVLPLLMAKFHLHGINNGWFQTEEGEAIESCVTIIVFITIILSQGIQILRADQQRKLAEAHALESQYQLKKANTELEIRVAERTAELSNLNDRLEEVGRVAKVGGWTLETASMKATWSRTVSEIHEAENLTQTTVDNGINYYAPEYRAIIAEAVHRACTKGESFDLELQIITAKGRRIWVRAIGKAYWTNGVISQIAGVFQDINSSKLAQIEFERIQSQNALRREDHLNQRFSIFMEHVPEAVFIFDASGKLIYTNPCFENTFSRQKDRSPILPEAEPSPPAASYAKELLDKLIKGPLNSEQTIQIAAGEERCFEIRRFPLMSLSESALFGGVAVDVTQKKRLQIQQHDLESHQRQQQKLEALGTMASGVAHEINNPINGIINYAQLIMDKSPEEGIQHTYAAEIIAESQRVASIVRNLLQFARQEKQIPSAWSIQEVIEDTLLLIRTLLQKDQIKLRMDIAPGLPRVICCKPQIQQVLINLITNSRDALNDAPSYAPTKLIEICCHLNDDLDAPMVFLSIADNGGGIDPAILPKIFDPFFTTKPLDKGTGLGLSISHGIMKEHGGSLTVDNSPSVGCTFHLALPIEHT